MPSLLASYPTGQFVQHPTIPGVAKIRAYDGGRLLVESFESAAQPVARKWSLPAEQCQIVTLPLQTRVYWPGEDGSGAWQAGRVVGGGPQRYAVRLPNREFDLQIPVEELYVRWNRPIQSPVEVLAAGANESGYFRDARIPMLYSLMGQRAASANFSALVSSAIEIYPHQVDAALTVLTDPVQRYLLADEVGLGKTIEAGLVLRQHLIDHPSDRIAVLAPDVLRRQWSAELRTKFFIDDFPNAEIRIGQHETPARWREYHGFDLVIVDEVHNLTRAGNPTETPYLELASLAHSVPRLILLSATPAAARPEQHLGLLHLLDPTLYKWSDLEQFRARFEDRRLLANAVHGLNAEFEMLLPDVLGEIATQIPQDVTFNRLADEVRKFLTEFGDLHEEADRPRLVEALEVLRAHISETYRMHRRMIRHRRADVLSTRDDDLIPFEVSSRSRPFTLAFGSQRAALLQGALLEWQQRVARWLLDHDGEGQASYGQVLAVLASRVDELSNDLIDALRWRLDGTAAAADRAGLSASERALLSNVPVLPTERQTLTELIATTIAPAPFLGRLGQALKGAQRPILFCGPGRLADELATLLLLRTKWSILRHTRGRDSQHIAADLTSWRSGGPSLLIIDDSGEDGVNLQEADVVVHLRLPWSPNRLEQRLGRVDRFAGWSGAGKEPAAQHCESGGSPDESFSAAWRELLVDAVGAFDGSLSALQDRLDELQEEIWEAALLDGPTAITNRTSEVAAALRRERTEIEAMDALESIHEDRNGLRVARAIARMEQGWQRHERALRAITDHTSGGIRLTVDPPSGSVAKFGFNSSAPPLISPLILAQARRRLPDGSMTGAFNRNISLQSAGMQGSGIRLFRIGNPLVELLGSVMAIDDRGQASALWRPGQPQETVHFGFEVVVEADLTAALGHSKSSEDARHAIRRHADLLLPPYIERVWVDTAGERVSDKQLLAWLNAPYGPRDINLNADRIAPVLNGFGGLAHFARAARTAEATARELVAGSESLREKSTAAYEESHRRLAVQRAQALARQTAGRLLSDTESYLTDVDMADLLIDGLRHPTIRIVAATCIVSGNQWGIRRAP
ncbi:protein DpdE [Polymorphospora sp. NPDC050346]|uniref:protein DpdE n=1 Tax=Polymorphospora sp. NPDC050346 TaxID=3155780 RepID=UPI0033FC2A8D